MAVTDLHVPSRARETVFPFTLTRDSTSGDGQTLSGYAAVFNSPTHIRDEDGEYDEVIAPGAFRKTIGRRGTALLFDHGKHPVIGNMPLGRITELKEDARGLYVAARLSDNWLVQPVRDAIRDGAIDGMSFRFEPKRQAWSGKPNPKCRYGDLRTLQEVAMPELGPVVFPAYKDTTVSVRSALRSLEQTAGVFHVEFRTMEDGLAVQDSGEGDPRALAEDAIEDLWGLNDFQSDCDILQFGDGTFTFRVMGAAQSDHPGVYQATYSYDAGQLSIGEPEEVPAGGMNFLHATSLPADLSDFDPNLNSAPLEGETRSERAKYNAAQIKALTAKGQTMPDGSYPIADTEDLGNAIKAVGMGNADHDSIRKYIIKRAKALGASQMIPDSWNADGSLSGTNSQTTGPSDELATTGPSDELATTVRTGPLTLEERRQTLRRIQLEARGIPRKAS